MRTIGFTVAKTKRATRKASQEAPAEQVKQPAGTGKKKGAKPSPQPVTGNEAASQEKPAEQPEAQDAE